MSSETDDPIVPAERLLGRFDAPQIIQCRVCMTLKPAQPLFFRNIRTTDRFRKTCRKCEQKSAYHRSLVGKSAAVRNDPRLQRAGLVQRELTALHQEHAQQSNANKAKGRAKQLDAQFTRYWTATRRLVVRWRTMTYEELHKRHIIARQQPANSVQATGDMFNAEFNPRIEHYLRMRLGVMSEIIKRMRSMDEWARLIGLHMPPRQWRDFIDKMGDNIVTDKQLIDAGLFELDPFVFATKDEIASLMEHSPTTLIKQGELSMHEQLLWEKRISRHGLLGVGGKRPQLFHLLQPGMRLNPVTLTLENVPAEVPAWLAQFNGRKENEV